jgi:hypothetical protein
VRTVRASGELELAPGRALDLWADPGCWHGFVEGFERVVEIDPGWPAPGAEVVWESGPEGRGRVVERVVEHEAGRRLVTEVSEQPLGGGKPRLQGRQTLELVGGVPPGAAEAAGSGAAGSGAAPAATRASSRAELRLDYELVRGRGSPGPVTDLLFVRRALRDALSRTLARFAAEAAREDAR